MRNKRMLPFLALKKFSLPIKLCLFVKLEPRKSHDPSNPTVYPDSSVLCLVSDGSALFCCQGGWIDLGWLLSPRAHSLYDPLSTGSAPASFVFKPGHPPHTTWNQQTWDTSLIVVRREIAFDLSLHSCSHVLLSAPFWFLPAPPNFNFVSYF